MTGIKSTAPGPRTTNLVRWPQGSLFSFWGIVTTRGHAIENYTSLIYLSRLGGGGEGGGGKAQDILKLRRRFVMSCHSSDARRMKEEADKRLFGWVSTTRNHATLARFVFSVLRDRPLLCTLSVHGPLFVFCFLTPDLL